LAAPVDRYPDIYGIRALKSCRARHYNLFGQRQRQSVRMNGNYSTSPDEESSTGRPDGDPLATHDRVAGKGLDGMMLELVACS
jgi:hypothetical protein